MALALLACIGLSAAMPAAAQPPSEQPSNVAEAVILATNSAHLFQGVDILAGDVMVNGMASGPMLDGVELSVQRITTVGSLSADNIKLQKPSTVGDLVPSDDIFCNTIAISGGSPTGFSCSPVTLPVFSELPRFVSQAPGSGAVDVVVPNFGSVTLAPGDFRDIIVGQGGTVIFSGGIYNLQSIDGNKDVSLLFDAASQVRVQGTIELEKDAIVGPSPSAGSGISASDLIFYVAHTNVSFNEAPAVHILQSGTVSANFYVPNGVLRLERGMNATGAFIARDVDVKSQNNNNNRSRFTIG